MAFKRTDVRRLSHKYKPFRQPSSFQKDPFSGFPEISFRDTNKYEDYLLT